MSAELCPCVTFPPCAPSCPCATPYQSGVCQRCGYPLAAQRDMQDRGNARIGERMRRYFPIDDDEDTPSAALPSSPPAQDET